MGAVADKMPMQTHFFLHLLLVSLGVAQSQGFSGDNEEPLGLPPVLEEVDNSCPLTHECIPKEQCYHFQEDLDQLRNITTGSVEYEEMFSELSKLVCNKEKRGYCCSTIATHGGIIGGSLLSCCRECRWNPRRKRCVSKRTGRRCPC